MMIFLHFAAYGTVIRSEKTDHIKYNWSDELETQQYSKSQNYNACYCNAVKLSSQNDLNVTTCYAS